MARIPGVAEPVSAYSSGSNGHNQVPFVGSTTTEEYDFLDLFNTTINNTYGVPPSHPMTVGHIVDYIGMVTVPIFFIIGIAGNTVTVAIMRTKAFRVMAISYVLIALSVSDTTLNAMVLFNKRFFIFAVGRDLRALNPGGCKFFFWLWRTAKMTSSWFVVLIAVDRFCAVWFPMRANDFNNKKNAIRGIVSVYLVIGGFNAVWVVFSDVIRNGYCLPNVQGEGYSPTLVKGFLLTGTSLYTHIPVFIIIILNALTVIKLVKQSRRRRQMSRDETVDELQDKTYKMSAMLLGVSIAFLVLVVPSSLMHVVSVYKGINIFQATDTPTVIAREVISCLEQLNYSINFYLYVMCSDRFRVEVGILFHMSCSGRKARSQSVSGSTNTRGSAMKMQPRNTPDRSLSVTSGSQATVCSIIPPKSPLVGCPNEAYMPPSPLPCVYNNNDVNITGTQCILAFSRL